MPLSTLSPRPLLPLSLQSSKEGSNRQFTCNSCVLSFSCGFRSEKVVSFRMTMVWFWLVNESGVYGGMKGKVGFWWANRRRKMAPPAHHSGIGPEAASGCGRTRKVVEHIYLIKAREDISEYEEKDMLDYLYTFQYHMNGIIAISLGRLSDPNADGFTHAAFMRFQKIDDLAKFYQKSALGVLKEHVMPYCHVCPGKG